MESSTLLSGKREERPQDTITTLEQPARMVSVIVPVTEQYDDLVDLYRAHAKVLQRSGRPFEFLFVVDDSCARAVQELEPIQTAEEPIQVFTLPRSFGEAVALSVGFTQAHGDVVLILPAYFQVAPEGVQEVLNRLDEGYDLVVTWRSPRIDPWVNRLQDYTFNFLTHWLTGVRFHDLGCRLKGMRRRVAQEIDLYGDLHRFLPLLAYQRGFRVVEVPVPQHPLDNQTKLSRPGVYLRRLLDILTVSFLFKFTKKPLRFFGLIGAGLFSPGLFIVLTLVIQRMLGMTALADRPLLIIGVLLMVLGVQVGSIGLLGEIIVFTHARKMRDYNIERILR